MNTLLIYFAIPVATVILSIVLQKILKSPLLVAGTFFAIFLVVTFAFFDASFLVFAILYTILAYVTAVLTRLVCRLLKLLEERNCNCSCRIVERPIAINGANQNSLMDNANMQTSQAMLGRNTNCNCGCSCGNSNRR